MFNYPGTYTDLYQLKMAQVYFLTGKQNDIALFDYFFRKLPFGNGYAVFAGLENLDENQIYEKLITVINGCRYSI